MAEYSVTFWLPFPPSANRLWRSIGKGRVIIGANYKKWKREAGDAALMQSLGKQVVLGVYDLELKLSGAQRKRGDADNCLKSVHDFCKSICLIIDDNLCRKTSVEWADTGCHDCLVTLTGEIAYKDKWEFAQAMAAGASRKAKEAKGLTQNPAQPAINLMNSARRG